MVSRNCALALFLFGPAALAAPPAATAPSAAPAPAPAPEKAAAPQGTAAKAPKAPAPAAAPATAPVPAPAAPEKQSAPAEEPAPGNSTPGDAAAVAQPEVAPAPVTLAEDAPSSEAKPSSTEAPEARYPLPVPSDAPTPFVRKGPLPSHFELGLTSTSTWYTHRSFDLFSDNNASSAFGLMAGYVIWSDDPLSLVPEIGLSANGEESRALFGGDTSTRLDALTLHAGASLRYALLPFLEPEVRVTAGAARLDAEMSTANDPRLKSGTLWTPLVTLGAGFSLHTRPGAFESRSGNLRSLLLGGTAEGGYQLEGSVDLTMKPDRESANVATSDMSLGTLERSGPYFRIAGFVRF